MSRSGLARRGPSRRTFVKGLAIGGAAASVGLWRGEAWAQTPGRVAPEVLSGTEFDLRIGETRVNITGRDRTALTINGSLPGPLLRWREGDTVTLRVTNTLDEDTSLHWHGILLPANMDGVPGMSFAGIHPGETFTYRFRVRQHGTYWYHSHSGFQEQQGVYAPLVIDPREPGPLAYDREHVVMLTDWTDESPARIFSTLKKESHYYNFRQRTVGDFFRDVRRHGLRTTLAERRAWGQMRMSATDLADVTGHTYTYLMNGQPPAAGWTGLVAHGERVRLRFINGSAMTYFDVRIPGLTMTVVAADGQPVRPVPVDEFRIGVAETYDVIVEPSGEDAFTIFAQSMDRTGYAAGTLAVRDGLRAAVPEVDPRPVLSMADMGHEGHAGHGGMDQATIADPHAGHEMPAAAPAPDPHAGHQMPAAPPAADPHAGHVMPAPAPEVDPHAGHQMPAAPPAADPHAGHTMPPPAPVPDPHAGHQMPAAPATADPHAGHAIPAAGAMQAHPASERGNPLVDMQTMTPASRLDDPGIGLRDNGRRVLTYADLTSAFPDPDGRAPARTIELHLTGHMERFAWSFDGVTFSDAAPIRLTYGERVRVVLVNDTMMAHTIHLHGMWSDLEDDEGRFKVRMHTVDMPPGTRRSYRVTADALGRWAFHCHMLYHMEAGMFREVRVEEGRRS
ncbi:MAG: copper resistance system multicopper oxidase [Vicinamibacterales bacterium]|nr:copper resistance system multicopper oxidase [Vicinamibacterales bacterium]